jgi:hypothetical protein
MKKWGLPAVAALLLCLTACSVPTTGPMQTARLTPEAGSPSPNQTSAQAGEPNGQPGPSAQAAERGAETWSVTVTVNGQVFEAQLMDNETARAWRERLPMTLTMDPLNGNEVYGNLEQGLPSAAQVPARIQAGDLMLYGSDCLVLFYETFDTSYRYTPIGRIQSPDGLTEALGNGQVTLTFACSS